MIRHSFALLTAVAFLTGCRKDSLPTTHILADLGYSHSISIHQALLVYDSTALNDSSLFVSPPTARIYRWTISPDSAGAHLAGNFAHGEPAPVFDRPGVYNLSAQIYDSATNHLLARTDTFTIEVTTDTLFPSTLIGKTDQLTVTCNAYGQSVSDTSTLDYSFELGFTTSDNYAASSIIPSSLTNANGIRVVFADTTSLPSFPFLPYGNLQWPIGTSLALTNFPVGSTQPFSVVWLDQTYTGTITRPLPGSLSFTWDNSGPVKIQRGAMIQ
jgi:hypothetical protein